MRQSLNCPRLLELIIVRFRGHTTAEHGIQFTRLESLPERTPSTIFTAKPLNCLKIQVVKGAEGIWQSENNVVDGDGGGSGFKIDID